jgi:creatinine amidohydrolase/Fe(II)-dependent formamide hydrolase-like protein
MIARIARSLLVILILAASQALAQAPQPVFLDELTSNEIRDQIRAGRRTIIVPIGGTEQNGPHMVLGKHNVRVKVLAEKIALALGDAVVAPVMAYVPEGGIAPPTSHMRFAGTISIPDQAFQTVLEYAARSFKLHGFRDIVFLGDHAGYQKDEKAVADRLNREWASTSARVHALPEFYDAVSKTYKEELRKRGFADDEIGTHAGLADTSLALAIDPLLVRRELLKSARAPGVDREAAGVAGDPRRATAELGQAGVDIIVTLTVEAIKRAVARR